MILKALYDYYHRCKEIDPNIPALGFDVQSIDMVIFISKEGKILDIFGESESIIPRQATNKTSGDTPNILYDKADYMLNLDKKNKNIPKQISKRCQTEIDIVYEICEMFPTNATFNAIKTFYDEKEFLKIPIKWPEIFEIICKKNPTITFRIQGDSKLASSYSPELEKYIKTTWDRNPKGRCMITGKSNVPLMNTTASTPLGIATNGKIVSFQENMGFDSYGKVKGANAPISIEAECAFSYSLKTLIRSSENNIIFFKKDKDKKVVDKMLLFWCSKKELETPLFSFIKPKDNPNANVRSVKDFFEEIKKTGQGDGLENEYFYFIELSPTSKGRIAISFWNKCQVNLFAQIVNKHIIDLSICSNNNIKRGPLHIVNSASLRKDNDYVYVNSLIDSVIKSIITGSNYPMVLYNCVLNRIFAEQQRPLYSEKNDYYAYEQMDTQRAAICRAYLNRNFNYNINIDMNKDFKSKGYLCGRLFALLERTQEIANYKTSGEWKSNLRTKYMNTAMTRPLVVFPVIMANSNYYLDKISNIGWIEDLKEEIINKIDNEEGFPPHLTNKEQGLFFIGYYHQRYELLNKNKEIDETNIN